MSHSCCALRFMQVLCFEIRAGARVTQGAGSHMFCIGPGLIKFASGEGGAREVARGSVSGCGPVALSWSEGIVVFLIYLK
jgi:hypothetical protein